MHYVSPEPPILAAAGILLPIIIHRPTETDASRRLSSKAASIFRRDHHHHYHCCLQSLPLLPAPQSSVVILTALPGRHHLPTPKNFLFLSLSAVAHVCSPVRQSQSLKLARVLQRNRQITSGSLSLILCHRSPDHLYCVPVRVYFKDDKVPENSVDCVFNSREQALAGSTFFDSQWD